MKTKKKTINCLSEEKCNGKFLYTQTSSPRGFTLLLINRLTMDRSVYSYLFMHAIEDLKYFMLLWSLIPDFYNSFHVDY